MVKIISKVCTALEEPYRELLEALPAEAILNVDETGHKDNGKWMWTWCFRAGLYTLFKIDPFRSADVLIEVLGKEFDGVLGCDCFGAYRRYMREFDVTLQFCLAHLIRDVKFLMTLPGKKDRAYGVALRDTLRTLFRVIHRHEQFPRKSSTGSWKRRERVCCERANRACRPAGPRRRWRRGCASTVRNTSRS